MSNPHRPRPLWSREPWKWLFSLRVGLILLFLLALASIAGTMIPEVKNAEGRVVETALDRSQRLVFYSGWYKALLLLMAINMAFATFRTLVEKVLPATRPRFQRQGAFYTASFNKGEIPFAGDAETVAGAFRRHGFKVFTEGPLGYAIRGMLGRWGAPISHLGMVIVLLGAFAAAWFAQEEGVYVYEGETTDTTSPHAQGETGKPLGFTLRCEDFVTGFFPKTRIPSRFTSIISVKEGDGPWRTGPVEVNHSMHAAGWTLHQTSYDEVPELERYVVAVKAPDRATTATVELTPTQRREIAGWPGTELEIAADSSTWTVYKNGKQILTGPLGGAPTRGPLNFEPANSDLPGGWSLRPIQFEPDFVMGQSIGSRSQELNNPALKVALLQKGDLVANQWLFGRADMKEMMKGMQHQNQDKFDLELTQATGSPSRWQFEVAVRPMGETTSTATMLKIAAAPPAPSAPVPTQGWLVKIQERVPGYQTYISLTRNPMIPVVYFGCAVMLLGLLVAFISSPRRIWFRVDAAARKLQVAAVYRNQTTEPGLDHATRAVLDELAK